MKNKNLCSFLGNVGNNPEVKTFDNGKKVASFSIATSETHKDSNGVKQEKTYWHSIVAWGALAEIVEKYVKKGSKVSVDCKHHPQTVEKGDLKVTYSKFTLVDLILLDKKYSEDSQVVESVQRAAEETTDDLPF